MFLVYGQIWPLYIAVLFLGAAKSVQNYESLLDADTERHNRIIDIETNVTIIEKDVLQLHVSWIDTLPNDTTYNILISPIDPNECYESTCSVYGIRKPNDILLIPETSMSHFELRDCGYMFDCNYTMILENSNGSISKKTSVSIPYCVQDVCSCKHATELPKVTVLANITDNSTIDLNWSISLDRFPTASYTVDGVEVLNNLTSAKIYIKINEQTNPSLSWGGKLRLISEDVYSIHSLVYTMADNKLRGEIRLHIDNEINRKTVLNLNTYLIDALKCPGPDSLFKIRAVPLKKAAPIATDDFHLVSDNNFNTPSVCKTILFTKYDYTDFDAHFWVFLYGNRDDRLFFFEQGITWIILLIFVVMITFAAAIISFSFCGRQKPTPLTIKMEDNVNYIGADIELLNVSGESEYYQVSATALRIDVAIGEGNFGCVYKGHLIQKHGTTVVAVKEMKNIATSDERDEFLSEILLLKELGHHENIISFLGCCTARQPYRMIMEYAGRGDLRQYLHRVRAGMQEAETCKNGGSEKYIELKQSESSYTITDDFEHVLDHMELHNFALQIANGMRFLEERQICHRDLAARNILIDDTKTLKISDFGLSRHGNYFATTTKNRLLPLRWMALESIRHHIYTNKTDVWSYGVVLWEIGTLGALPYVGIAIENFLFNLLSGHRLPKPEICTPEVYDLMLQCWQEDPAKRPTFEELYKILCPKSAYVDVNSLSDGYIYHPIQD